MTKREARRIVRKILADRLRGIASELPPGNLADEILDEWRGEVMRIADRIAAR